MTAATQMTPMQHSAMELLDLVSAGARKAFHNGAPVDNVIGDDGMQALASIAIASHEKASSEDQRQIEARLAALHRAHPIFSRMENNPFPGDGVEGTPGLDEYHTKTSASNDGKAWEGFLSTLIEFPEDSLSKFAKTLWPQPKTAAA